MIFTCGKPLLNENITNFIIPSLSVSTNENQTSLAFTENSVFFAENSAPVMTKSASFAKNLLPATAKSALFTENSDVISVFFLPSYKNSIICTLFETVSKSCQK